MPRLREAGQPSWPAILNGVVEKTMRNIHGALPGRVRSYDVAAQTADIQLLIQLYGEPTTPLLEVPVCWPSGAAGHLHVPLAAGDTVLVVFVDEDFGPWWSAVSPNRGGSINVPQIDRRHGMHPVAIPGFWRAADALPVTGGHVTLAATDELRLGDDGATDPVALAPAVEAQLADLVTRIGLWKAEIAALAPATPVTNGTLAGFITTLETILTGWPASVGAEKVRAV